MSTDMVQQERLASEVFADLSVIERSLKSITEQSEHDTLRGVLGRVRGMRKQADALKKEWMAPVNEMRDKINGVFKPKIKHCESVEAEIKQLLNGWDQKLELEAKAKAEAERESQAEKRKAEEQALKDMGLEEVVEEKRRAPEAVAPVVAKPHKTRENWKAEVVDKAALVRAVCEGKVPLDAVDVRLPVLNRLAAEQKEQFDVPGCRAHKELVYGS